MDRQEILTHFTNKLNEMIEANEFWAIYFQDPFSIYNEKEIPFPVRFGVSRGCYVDPDFPYVVKWQLTGDSFECEKEEEIYNIACGEDLEQYFAEPVYIGEYIYSTNTFSIRDYLEEGSDEYYPSEKEFAAIITTMEQFGYERARQHIHLRLWAYPKGSKVDMFSREYSVETRNSAASSQDSHDPLGMYIDIACCWIEEIGIKEYNRLNGFLTEWGVNDLHGGNILQINGHLVIIDYAGVLV